MGGGGGGVDFEIIKPERDGTIFMGEVDLSRHHVKVLIWQL